MAVYLVERDLSGIRVEQLAAAQLAAIRTSQQFSQAGMPVRYIRSTFVPTDGHCACLFEALDPIAVRQVNDAAGLPYFRIVEALDLTLKARGSEGSALKMNRLRIHRRSCRLLAAIGAVVLSTATMVCPARAAETLVSFNVPGTYVWQVPPGVHAARFDVSGAQGGKAAGGQFGGFGGRAIATLSVFPGELIEVNVGGAGGDSPSGQFAFGRGGYNGGAKGGSGEALALNAFGGGGGGGASDVRRPQFFGSGFIGRVIVAGGGGGGSLGCTGGAGGGPLLFTGGGCDKWSGLPGGVNPGGGRGGTRENDICCSDGAAGVSGFGGTGASVPLIAAAGEGVGGGGGGGGYIGGGGGSSGTHVPNTGFASIGGGAGGGGGNFITAVSVLGSVTPIGGVRPGDGLVDVSYFVPTVSASAAPAANAFGWNSSIVDVTFSGDSGSFLNIGSIIYSTSGSQVTPDTTVNGSYATVTISAEGTTSVRGVARDTFDDESAPASVEVKIDTTPPTIFDGRNLPPNANGWNNTDVTVTWACNDALSGVQSCSTTTVMDREGSRRPRSVSPPTVRATPVSGWCGRSISTRRRQPLPARVTWHPTPEAGTTPTWRSCGHAPTACRASTGAPRPRPSSRKAPARA
jgi:hypothetical protein